MNRTERWRFSDRLLPLLLGAALAACGDEPAGEEPHSEASNAHSEHEEGLVIVPPERLAQLELTAAPVERRVLAPQLTTTGEVGYEEDRLAHVSPRIPGRVQRVAASLGDEVRRGEVLAMIDSVELGRARSDYRTARAREDLARENHEREKRLFAERVSSEKEMLEARAAYEEAVAERERAEETLRLYGVSPGGSGSLLPVRAPIAGRVVEKHVTIGELVTPERNLFTLADLGHVWIWIDVFERDLAAVHLGDGVEVEVDAYPGTIFAGEVTYLSPQVADATRTVRARIDVANPDRRLRPGMFARVRLTDPHAAAGAGSAALVVPQAAVVRRGEETIVFIPRGEGRFEARPVTTGRAEEDRIEITDGLEDGERVVISETFYLKSELAREDLGGGHDH